MVEVAVSGPSELVATPLPLALEQTRVNVGLRLEASGPVGGLAYIAPSVPILLTQGS